MINHLNSNGFFPLVGCNNIGIFHHTHIVESGYKLKKNIVFFYVMIFVTFTNSVDPDKCSNMLHFISVFTVCKSTRLWASSIQRHKLIRDSLQPNWLIRRVGGILGYKRTFWSL